MKTVLFARVSTKEQAVDGYSLDSQRKLLEDYSAQKSLFISKRFIVPESASGKQERKEFNEMLDYLYANPDVKILLVEKVDRASRNFKDSLKLDEWLNGDEERQIHFVKQNLVIHKNSKSHEKFQWDIYLVLARQYSNNLSEETKKGMIEKAEQNWYPGNHKRGYTTVGDTGKKIWTIDTSPTSEAPYIKKAFELYDTGRFTLLSLKNHLVKEGWKTPAGRPVAKSTVHKVLRDCFYCGEFEWGNKHYKQGNHEPLVSKELFQRVQDRIDRKLVGKAKKHDFLLAGMVECEECGRSVCGEVQKGHHYFRCTRYNTNCTQRGYTREEKLEEQIIRHLSRLRIQNERLAEWLKKALKESHADEVRYHNAALADLSSRLARTQQRVDTLYDEKIDGNITPEFYDKKFTQYSKELDEITASIERHKNANVSYVELGSAIIDLTQRAEELYKNKATPEQKRKLLNIVFGKLLLKDKVVTPVYNKAFEFLAERVNTLNSEEFTLEPKITSDKAVTLESELNSEDWLPGRDSNPGDKCQKLASYH